MLALASAAPVAATPEISSALEMGGALPAAGTLEELEPPPQAESMATARASESWDMGCIYCSFFLLNF
jgi:hypothetical protein